VLSGLKPGETVMGDGDTSEEPWKGTANGRDAKGLFATGNQIARGNLGAGRMKALRVALLNCATLEKIKRVEAALYEMAISGDVQAIKVWLDHMAGRAPQAIEHSGKVETPPGRVIIVESNGRPTRPPLGMQEKEEHAP
jgi:hypothetical protein